MDSRQSSLDVDMHLKVNQFTNYASSDFLVIAPFFEYRCVADCAYGVGRPVGRPGNVYQTPRTQGGSLRSALSIAGDCKKILLVSQKSHVRKKPCDSQGLKGLSRVSLKYWASI